MRLLFCAVAPLMVVGLAGQAWSQTVVTERGDDLIALIRETVGTNPSIDAQRHAVDGLRARIAAARAAALPRADVSGAIQRRWTDNIGGTQPDAAFTSRLMSVDATWRFFDGFQTSHAVAASKAELASGEASLQSTTADTIFELLNGLAALHRDRQLQAYIGTQRDTIGARGDQTKRRFSLGEATRTDMSQADARLALAASNLDSAQGAVATSESVVIAIAGRLPLGQELPPLPRLPETLDAARSTALAANPRVLGARRDAVAAEKQIGVARAQGLPTIDAVGGAGYLGGGVPNIFIGRIPNERTSTYVGVQARVPLFQGFGERAALRRAKALYAERNSTVIATERDVLQQLTAAWTRMLAARAAIASADSAIAASRAAVGFMSRELDLGARTAGELLDAERDLLEAEARLAQLRYEEYVAQAAVLRVTGDLTVDAFTR
jgi:outer membrane protein